MKGEKNENKSTGIAGNIGYVIRLRYDDKEK